jgi:arylsulfatase A-like enzyme
MAKAHGSHAEVLRSGRWKDAIQAYLAAISYVDGQIGRVLDALESSPHRDNTIVCLWGDHGDHLGEKEHWSKFTLWGEATRAPFLWVVPHVTQPGSRCTRAVDFMSIYPTLCALVGIPRPANVEGLNIAPLLANPEAAWDAPAVTTHGPNNHAIRTERWRFIRYADGSEELYDHEQDPYEWTNLAALADKESVKTVLAAWLPKENMPVLPNGKSKPK